MTTEVLNIKILGMSCENCEKTITEALEKLKGISKVSVSHKKSKGHIEFNHHQVKQEIIEEEITKLGYQVKKSAVQKWLERLAKSNEKQFGHKQLDCCSIDKQH